MSEMSDHLLTLADRVSQASREREVDYRRSLSGPSGYVCAAHRWGGRGLDPLMPCPSCEAEASDAALAAARAETTAAVVTVDPAPVKATRDQDDRWSKHRDANRPDDEPHSAEEEASALALLAAHKRLSDAQAEGRRVLFERTVEEGGWNGRVYVNRQYEATSAYRNRLARLQADVDALTYDLARHRNAHQGDRPPAYETLRAKEALERRLRHEMRTSDGLYASAQRMMSGDL